MKWQWLAVAGALASAPAVSQDFLQQWRDSAAVAMKEFRAANGETIRKQGWHFVDGSMNGEGVPLADVFMKDVKAQSGATRAAQVLSAFYQPASTPEGVGYRSSRATVAIDCAAGRLQQLAVAYFESPDASGEPAAPAVTAAGDAHEPQAGTPERALLAAVCSAKT
jgi:hypothetical protein